MDDPILEASAAARTRYFAQEQTLLQKLAHEGQAPYALFITCSDARIMPAQLLGAKAGDLFMIRNVANLIPPYIQTEAATVASLEFAIHTLQLPHIIVCGHTDCGGIKALDTLVDISKTPAISRWLDLARPAQRQVDFAHSNLDEAARHLAIVRQNVANQLHNLRSYPFVRAAVAAQRLTLHGWVYDLAGPDIVVVDTEDGA